MRLTGFSDVGLRILIRLAAEDGRQRISTRQIAEDMQISYTHATKACAHLAASGCERVILYVESDNPAVRLYERTGMAQVAANDAVTIGAETWRVLYARKIDDGRIWRCRLSRSTR